jgi:hypothetical protein
MNIIVTGGTSQIGKLLTYKLRQHGHQVIEIGRNKHNFWQLGSPIPDVVKGEILIHLAHDRGRSIEQSISDTKALLNGYSGFPIFLSSTSAHSNSYSNYGKSKFFTEQIFIEKRGAVIKAGLICGSIKNRFLEEITKKLRAYRCVILPYRGFSRFFISDADTLVSEIILIAQTKRVGKIRGFSLMPTSFRNLLMKTNCDLKFTILTIPSKIFSNLLIRTIRVLLPLNETVDSLLSLVSEIELLEITSLQSPVNEFNVPLKL